MPVVVGCRAEAGRVLCGLGLQVLGDDLARLEGIFVHDVAAVDAREVATATGTVVVGHHVELLGRIDGLAVEGEAADALAVAHLDPVLAVTGGLGDVHLVADPVNHVEVVGGEVLVHQPLHLCLGGVDPVELAGAHLQPLLDGGPVHLDHLQGVRVDVEVGDVAQGDVTLGHIGEVIDAVAPATERGRHRQDRIGLLEQAVFLQLLGVAALGIAHQLHRGVVLHQGEEAVDGRGDLAERLVQPLVGGVVIGLHQVHHPLIHGAALAGVDLAQAGLALFHLPLAVHLLQLEVDDAEVVAPVAGHHGRDAAEGTGLVVHLRQIREVAGEVLVGMAQHQGIDPLHLGQVPGGVLHHGLVAAGVDAGMGHHHHQIGALGTHLGHVVVRGLDHVGHHHLAFQMAFVPLQHLGRGQAQNAHLDGLTLTLVVGHLAIQQQVGGELVATPLNLPLGVPLEGRRLEHVGVHIGELGSRQHLAEVVQAVVELVVAEVAGVIAELVHRLEHRVRLLLQVTGAGLFEDVVRQRRALDQVAVVEQQVVGVLGAGRADQQGGAGEAELAVLLVLVVVIPQHVGVDIGGLDQAQGDGPRLRLAVVFVAAGRQQHDGGNRPQLHGVIHCIFPFIMSNALPAPGI